MAATDYSMLIVNRAHALLEAHAPVTTAFKTGNRIKFDKAAYIGARSPNDFPRYAIFPPSIDDTFFALEQHYGHTASFNVSTMPWTEDMTLIFNMSLIFRDAVLATATGLIHEVLTALRKGGPAWGLNISPGQIMRIGPASVQNSIMRASDDPLIEVGDDFMHVRSNIAIPVLLRLKGSQLIT